MCSRTGNYARLSEIWLLKTRISMNNSRESEGFVENKIGGAPALTVSFWAVFFTTHPPGARPEWDIQICFIPPRVPIPGPRKMVSIHPFRFLRAYRKGHELGIGFTIPRSFRQSRFVVRFDLLWNVHFRSQIPIWLRFDRQTRVPGKPPKPLWYPVEWLDSKTNQSVLLWS